MLREILQALKAKPEEGGLTVKLLVGLGNPGEEYAQTKHNIGFRVVDRFAAKHGLKVERARFQALTGEGRLNGQKIVLVKPMTYMNLSGRSVAPLVNWYKCIPQDIIVVYDDKDLPLGKLRIRLRGSAGGHNGVKSLISHLGTQEFPRIKVGIGQPLPAQDTAEYVLSRFTREEEKVMNATIDRAVEALETILTEGVQVAMNKFNG